MPSQLTAAERKVDQSTDISFRFGKESKIKPSGLDKLTIDEDMTITLKGKLISFSKGDPWDETTRFTLRLTACDILPTEAVDASLDAAIRASKNNLKKMEK